MADVLSTEQVDPRERLAYWREVICHTFIKLDVTQTQAGLFRGAVRTDQVGDIQVTRIRTDPMVAERSRRHLRAAEEERCLVALQLRGRTVGRQDGRDVVLEPGDLALFDSTRPYLVDFQGMAFDHLVLQFPRSVLLDRDIEPSRATARRITAGSVLGRLVSPFLINVARVAAQTSPRPRSDSARCHSTCSLRRSPTRPALATARHHRAVMNSCSGSSCTCRCTCPTRSWRRPR